MIVALLVVVAAATSGDGQDGAAAVPPGAEPVALMHVLVDGRAAGRVVRDAGGRPSAQARAFTDALSIGFTVAAACALVGALAARRWLPARHRARATAPVGLAPPVVQEGAA